ncbi:hypothetical protein V6Z11_A05G404700 [Gossypium hirsutum]
MMKENCGEAGKRSQGRESTCLWPLISNLLLSADIITIQSGCNRECMTAIIDH